MGLLAVDVENLASSVYATRTSNPSSIEGFVGDPKFIIWNISMCANGTVPLSSPVTFFSVAIILVCRLCICLLFPILYLNMMLRYSCFGNAELVGFTGNHRKLNARFQIPEEWIIMDQVFTNMVLVQMNRS